MSRDVQVGIVVFSHSARLAAGLAELAGQMAPKVRIVPVGGLDNGSLGTDYEALAKAVNALHRTGVAVAIIPDLGSAKMCAQMVEEAFASAWGEDQVRVLETVFLEGTVACAVAAAQGDGLVEVADVGVSVCRQVSELSQLESSTLFPAGLGPDGAVAASTTVTAQPSSQTQAPNTISPAIPSFQVSPVTGSPSVTQQGGQASVSNGVVVKHRQCQVADPTGLHARPAALLARLAGGFDAEITIDGANASSVLALMSLGISYGDTVEIAASGPEAEKALDALCGAITTGLAP